MREPYSLEKGWEWSINASAVAVVYTAKVKNYLNTTAFSTYSELHLYGIMLFPFSIIPLQLPLVCVCVRAQVLIESIQILDTHTVICSQESKWKQQIYTCKW